MGRASSPAHLIMKHLFKFRWPIKQVDATTIEILSSPNGQPILDRTFRESLTDQEAAQAEHVVIRELAILDE